MSVRAILLLLVLEYSLAAAILLGGMAPGRADPLAWRIEVRACRGAACRTLPGSARRWDGRFACQDRAALIELFGPAPRGRTLRASCLPIDGMPGA